MSLPQRKSFSSRSQTLCVLDEHELIVGIDNWVNYTSDDLDLVFVTRNLQTLLGHPRFPTDVVYFTVLEKMPSSSLESRVRLLTRSGAKAIALLEHEFPETRARAIAAGAAGAIGAQRSYRKIVDLTRDILSGRKLLSAKEQAQVLTPEEAEVLRLHALGTPPLLMGRTLNASYDQVQTLLKNARLKQATLSR